MRPLQTPWARSVITVEAGPPHADHGCTTARALHYFSQFDLIRETWRGAVELYL
jgi:hypothetical protein